LLEIDHALLTDPDQPRRGRSSHLAKGEKVITISLKKTGLRLAEKQVGKEAAKKLGEKSLLKWSMVLVIETTASFPMLLPMLAACFASMLVPTLLGDPPIYDSLRSR
jgi:hypothetical protein